MKETISAAIYETHGKPSEVLKVRELPRPSAGEGEVVVEMRAAPINPADLNAIEGKYPLRPALPATPGFEGSGFITEIGAGVKNFSAGTQVILPHDCGTWREALAVKAEKLVAVPEGIDPQQAAMLKINPITAWRMLHDFVKLNRGDWLIQNAANSAAGRATIQISRELGYKTVNVVRRSELIEELRAEGGDVVLVDGENLRAEVKEATRRCADSSGAKRSRGRERVASREHACAGSYNGHLWRHELSAAENSQRTAHLQESPLLRILGK